MQPWFHETIPLLNEKRDELRLAVIDDMCGFVKSNPPARMLVYAMSLLFYTFRTEWMRTRLRKVVCRFVGMMASLKHETITFHQACLSLSLSPSSCAYVPMYLLSSSSKKKREGTAIFCFFTPYTSNFGLRVFSLFPKMLTIF
jgi:hypothetical protein